MKEDELENRDTLLARKVVDTLYDEYNLSSYIVRTRNQGIAVIVPINEEFKESDYILGRLKSWVMNESF